MTQYATDQFVTFSFAGALDAVPAVTTTACVPTLIPEGTVKLICVTPAEPGGFPTNTMVAVAPPTLTPIGCCGFGRSDNAVEAAGAAPVDMAGETPPTPVT